MELEEMRVVVDGIDDEMLSLWEKRMDITSKIGAYKRAHGLDVFDEQRETDLIHARISALADQTLTDAAEAFIRAVITISREDQKGNARGKDAKALLYHALTVAFSKE